MSLEKEKLTGLFLRAPNIQFNIVLKINVDVSFFGNMSRSGYRGLIRNSVGGWLIRFSGSFVVLLSMLIPSFKLMGYYWLEMKV